MSSLVKTLFGKSLGSISMYFDILERIRFIKKIILICVMRINGFDFFSFSSYFLDLAAGANFPVF